MNEEDEFISVRRLRSTRTSLETSVKHSMSGEASLGLRLVGEDLSEESCPPRTRKKIRRGIVWQVAYDVHSEHHIVGSSAITPYTH